MLLSTFNCFTSSIIPGCGMGEQPALLELKIYIKLWAVYLQTKSVDRSLFDNLPVSYFPLVSGAAYPSFSHFRFLLSNCFCHCFSCLDLPRGIFVLLWWHFYAICTAMGNKIIHTLYHLGAKASMVRAN